MYKKTLKVYDEDLNYANTPGVVNVGGTMGALAIDLVAIADAETFKATTVQVLQGDAPDNVTEECVTFVSKAASNVKAGDVVEGTVDSIKPYGAFIKLDDGVDGLLHVSQISTQRIKHPSAVLTEGQTVKVKILSTQEGKLSLSMKVLAEQQADREEHETFDYKETGTVSTGLGDLLKGLKL